MTSRLSPLVGCLAALLALSTLPATAFAQTAPASAAVAAAAPARLLVAHPVVAALTTALVRDTGIVVLRPVPETLPPNRQLAFFSGRGAAGLGEAARQAGRPGLIGNGQNQSGFKRNCRAHAFAF